MTVEVTIGLSDGEGEETAFVRAFVRACMRGRQDGDFGED